jgi:hypothetical protein
MLFFEKPSCIGLKCWYDDVFERYLVKGVGFWLGAGSKNTGLFYGFGALCNVFS